MKLCSFGTTISPCAPPQIANKQRCGWARTVWTRGREADRASSAAPLFVGYQGYAAWLQTGWRGKPGAPFSFGDASLQLRCLGVS